MQNNEFVYIIFFIFDDQMLICWVRLGYYEVSYKKHEKMFYNLNY